MKSRDFTLLKYEELCRALRENKYRPLTVSSYLESHKSNGNQCILRHDVDRKPKNALKMAEMESKLGIKSTYYFRYPNTFIPETIRRIASLGHEIGYHYETLSKAKGNHEKAIELFAQELEEFRKIARIRTICMHGSPLSKHDNRDMWEREDFHKFGILGEASISISATKSKPVRYFTDTGRSWNSKNNLRDNISGERQEHSINSTDDLINFIKSSHADTLYITAHPERWGYDGYSWLLGYSRDLTFGVGKRMLRASRGNKNGD